MTSLPQLPCLQNLNAVVYLLGQRSLMAFLFLFLQKIQRFSYWIKIFMG